MEENKCVYTDVLGYALAAVLILNFVQEINNL